MKRNFSLILFVFSVCFMSLNCKSKIKLQEDEIYSRHLQEHIKLSIISSPMPDDKASMNLLLLNDGQDASELGIKEIVDSLYKKKLIQPLIIVAIHAGDRMQDYGVSGFPDYRGNGNKAGKYASFIDNELYDFIKKKAGVRKFNTVSIAGCSLGGLSAFDIAWDHADKIDKVGVFSGSFRFSDKDTSAKDYSDDRDRIMQNKIRSSRKRPKLKYWFYAGVAGGKMDRDTVGGIDVADDTKDLVEIIKSKNVCPPGDIVYRESPDGKPDYTAWRKAFPEFLRWACGR